MITRLDRDGVGNNKLLRENEINSRGIWWFLLPWFFSEICVIKKIFEIYRRLSAEISGKDWVTSTCAYSYLDFVRSSSLVFLNSEASKMLTARYFRSVSLIRSCFNVSSWNKASQEKREIEGYIYIVLLSLIPNLLFRTKYTIINEVQ